MESSTPIFAKRTKSRSIRPRLQGDDEDVSDQPEASPSTLVTKLKNKHKSRQKPKSRLSFGGDEAESDDVFTTNKSNSVRKLMLSSRTSVAIPMDLDAGSTSAGSDAPIYSKEYLSELKANTVSTPNSKGSTPVPDYDSSFDISMDQSGFLADMSGMEDQSILDIPTESSIRAAKQKREMLRTSGAANNGEEDFISLSVVAKDDVPKGPHPDSRLVREEDELGEGDEEFAEYTSAMERIALGSKAKKKEATQRKEAMKEMIEDAEEVDEETQQWELEQLRRGGNLETDRGSVASAKAVYKPAPIPSPTPIPVLDTAVTRISLTLSSLTSSHASNTSTLSTITDDQQAFDDKEKEMRELVEETELKRSWFVAFRNWVESVAAFLDDKYPILERIEDEHLSLLKERFNIMSTRRRQEDEDDLSQFLGTLPQPPEEQEEDELGRQKPPNNAAARIQRMSDRSGRRLKRGKSKEDEDGYSTDGSLPPSERIDYQDALSTLSEKVNNVLGDVRSSEFQDPAQGIGKWFGQWRDKYSETYIGAYGGLGMISAWEFWARLEIVGWDPMDDPRALDSFAWYTSLYEYSRVNSGNEGFGPDGDLVSAMISTAVVPRLIKVVQGGSFDAYSAKHTRRILDLCDQVEASSTPEKLEMLLKSVLNVFKKSAEATGDTLAPYLQLNSPSFNPQAIPARRQYLTRRYKLLNNLLRWRKHIGGKLGINEMIIAHVSNNMLPIAETGWEVGGEEIMRKVLNILPPDICPSVLRSRLSQ